MEQKHCNRCDTTKPHSEFYKNKAQKSGLSTECRECTKARRAEHYDKNRDRLRAGFAEYQTTSRDKIRARKADYYATNKERILEKSAAYYAINTERIRQQQSEYCKTNPDIFREKSNKRRSLKLAAFVEDVTVTGLRERDGDNCYLCSDPLDFTAKGAVHIEHKTPLSRGGEHSYANTALACASCNLSKGTKTPEEYLNTLKAV